jgi:hypothetical protein
MQGEQVLLIESLNVFSGHYIAQVLLIRNFPALQLVHEVTLAPQVSQGLVQF